MGEDASKLVCCVCKQPKSSHEGQFAELVRPSLLEFMKKRLPDCAANDFVCYDDLGEFRKSYVKDALED
jgi:hypothetical protein